MVIIVRRIGLLICYGRKILREEDNVNCRLRKISFGRKILREEIIIILLVRKVFWGVNEDEIYFFVDIKSEIFWNNEMLVIVLEW